MASLDLFSLLKNDEYFRSVDLFGSPNRADVNLKQTVNLSADGAPIDNSSPHAEKANSEKDRKTKNGHISLLIDSESCLDRLYGGYFSDWASGGQWNRMFNFLNGIVRACQNNTCQLTIAMRGGVEKHHADDLLLRNKDFRDRLSRVMIHLQNRGTPPPKVWWLPPTCLREALRLAFEFYGVPILCTYDDYYLEVMNYVESCDIQGILTDDYKFAFFGPPRLFAAHDIKFTFRHRLETNEYMFEKWLIAHHMKSDRLSLLASLLGNHILPVQYLKEFHEELKDKDNRGGSSEEADVKLITEILNFVLKFPDPSNLDAIGNVVFRNSSCNLEEGISKLKESVSFFQRTSTIKLSTKAAMRSTLVIDSINGDLPDRKRAVGLNEHYVRDDEVSECVEEHNICKVNGNSSKPHAFPSGVASVLKNSVAKDKNMSCHVVQILPSDAILKLCVERHRKGLMSPFIVQALVEREVRLPCYIETLTPVDNMQSIIEIYRPIRQSSYAILHNLNKHLYDTKKSAQETGSTVFADDIKMTITEHYLSLSGEDVSVQVGVTPLSWPVPSVESLWLGVKPENKLRRMKAFLSCMLSGSDSLLTNVTHIPERFLLLCCVLRYLLKCEPAGMTLTEFDAALATATSPLLFDVQFLQDMQLPLITPRGSQIASIIMAGIQHAMFVNDVCGAPVRREMTPPWLYFDGKLFQYKLLKATSTHHIRPLELCDGQMPQLLQMEKLRQIILHGLHERFGLHYINTADYFMTALAPGHVFTGPAAYLRPTTSSSARGKGSLLGEFIPSNAQLDGRGGKLQVAGQIVATWGPRPKMQQLGRDGGSNTRVAGQQDLNEVHMGQNKTQSQKLSTTGAKKYNSTKNIVELKAKSQTSDVMPARSKSLNKHVTIAVKPDNQEQVDVKVLPDDDSPYNANNNVYQQEVSNHNMTHPGSPAASSP